MDKLNGLTADYNYKNAVFYSVFSDDELGETVFSIAPYSKILLLVCDSDYASLCFPILSALKKYKLKPVVMCLKDNTTLSLSEISGLFCAPEDVRAVLVLSEELLLHARYFCTLKSIPLIIYPQKYIPCRLFESGVYIKDGKEIFYSPLANKSHVIINDKITKEFVQNTFSTFVIKCVALMDGAFRIVDTNFYLLKRILTRCIGLLETEDFETIVFNALNFELLSSYIKGFYYSSLPFSASLLFGGSADFYADCGLRLYPQIFNQSCSNSVDYNGRAKLISLYSGLGLKSVLQNLKVQLDGMKFDAKNVKAEIISLIALGADLKKESGKIINESDGNLTYALLSGDTLLGVNGMSFVRENKSFNLVV